MFVNYMVQDYGSAIDLRQRLHRCLKPTNLVVIYVANEPFSCRKCFRHVAKVKYVQPDENLLRKVISSNVNNVRIQNQSSKIMDYIDQVEDVQYFDLMQQSMTYDPAV